MTCASKLLFAMLLAAFAAGCQDDEHRPCTIETMDCYLDLAKKRAGCSEYDPCCGQVVHPLAGVMCQADGGICVTFANSCTPDGWVLPRDGSVLPP